MVNMCGMWLQEQLIWWGGERNMEVFPEEATSEMDLEG